MIVLILMAPWLVGWEVFAVACVCAAAGTAETATATRPPAKTSRRDTPGFLAEPLFMALLLRVRVRWRWAAGRQRDRDSVGGLVTQPIVEARRTKPGVIARYKRQLVQLGAEIAGAHVCDHLTLISARREELAS